jgi:CRISPR/Cas system-associated protein Csm6
LRPLVERSLLRKSRYEVEKNLSRLAAAWRDRVAAEIDTLVLQAEQHARDELTALEHALTHAPSSAPRLREAIAELEAQRTEVASDLVGRAVTVPRQES